MEWNVINYLEKNRWDDMPKLVSRLIFKLMQNYENKIFIKDTKLRTNIMNFISSLLGACLHEDFNNVSKDSDRTREKERIEYDMILNNEFLLN